MIKKKVYLAILLFILLGFSIKEYIYKSQIESIIQSACPLGETFNGSYCKLSITNPQANPENNIDFFRNTKKQITIPVCSIGEKFNGSYCVYSPHTSPQTPTTYYDTISFCPLGEKFNGMQCEKI